MHSQSATNGKQGSHPLTMGVSVYRKAKANTYVNPQHERMVSFCVKNYQQLNGKTYKWRDKPMCIIAIKSAGTAVDWTILDNCEVANPDGAGYAYVRGDEVVIRKGFFDNETMLKALDNERIDQTETEIMFHFRIATHGKVAPATCHPFPMSENRKALCELDTTASMAVAHNGVIPFMPKDKMYSDTMQYISMYLAPLGEQIHNPAVRDVVEHSADSKLAIMTPNELYLLGSFIEDNGWTFSNASYEDDYLKPFASISTTYFPKKGSKKLGTSTKRVNREWYMGEEDLFNSGNEFDWNRYEKEYNSLEFCDSCQKQYDPATVDDSGLLTASDWYLCGDCIKDMDKIVKETF